MRIKQNEIDKGFIVTGTGPEQEVLYVLLENILASKTGRALQSLLNTKKKVTVSFQQKSDDLNLKKEPEGTFNPSTNKILLNNVLVRSFEARLSTLTHEVFHALQYQTGCLNSKFEKSEKKKVFLLNELEARFKGMEIISELYPYSNYINLNLNQRTKMDCLIYRAISNYYQKSLMNAGQRSEQKAKLIAMTLARVSMLESQVSCIPDEMHHLLGDIWSSEYQGTNQEWQETYKNHEKKWNNIRPFGRKLSFEEINQMIAKRLDIPDAFLNERIIKKISPINNQINRHVFPTLSHGFSR